MKSRHIVITGSTRGIGLGLARAFLARGHFVSVSGRHRVSVNEVTRQLQEEFGGEKVAGFVVDVTRPRSLDQLWLKASLWNPVDIWINNAGVGQPDELFHHIHPEVIDGVIQTNLMGVMNGTRVAYLHMKQQGHGAIYNMEGFGSGGRVKPGMTLYGTTQRAVRYFTRSVAGEMAESGVLTGTLNPGMAGTGLLSGSAGKLPENHRGSIRMFPVLTDQVDTIALYLAGKVLKNQKSNVRIAWLTPWRIVLRFFLSLFRHRRLN
jgi:NAD(P)-dependent dehydrogenase (short-subunit alcohol dehydrogenase family)